MTDDLMKILWRLNGDDLLQMVMTDWLLNADDWLMIEWKWLNWWLIGDWLQMTD